ncbi:MAG: dihydrodipicolinate reductase [Pseudomonadota bacterium]
MTLRVVQWTSGSVARQCVRAIIAHPAMELVGMYAYSPQKAGRDAGELVGLPNLGVAATGDIDALINLRPDCVSYSALHPDVGEITRILEAGINIVTTSMFLTGWNISTKQPGGIPDAIERIEAAGRKGNATIFGTGMNPGFINYLACVLTGISHRIDHVKLTESVDVSLFAGDANMDPMGWGLPPDSPGHAQRILEETRVFGDGVEVMAGILGMPLEAKRCTTEFAYAKEDLKLDGRHIAKGTVAGIKLKWEGVVGGVPRIENCQIWAMTKALEPAWSIEHAYLIDVRGDPSVHSRIDILPAGDLTTMDSKEFHAVGMTITGLPSINAIPAVCEAPAGIRTYADLPVVAGTGRVGTDQSVIA